MFHAKGYGKKRIILATPKTVAKATVKETDKQVLEEPTPVKEGKKILVESVEEAKVEEPVEEAKVEEPVVETKVEEPVVEKTEETKTEAKPKKKAPKKKAE